MMTVRVYINDDLIYDLKFVNKKKKQKGKTVYELEAYHYGTDDAVTLPEDRVCTCSCERRKVMHKREDGALALICRGIERMGEGAC